MLFQFTYSNDPENEPRDAVRLLIGDTDDADPLLSDTEVTFYLTENGDNKYRAAIESCRAIAAKLSRRPDHAVGRVIVSYQQRAQEYLKLAETLRQKYLMSTVTPYAGGIGLTDKDAQENDTDRTPPFFTRNLHSPGVIPPTNDTTLI